MGKRSAWMDLGFFLLIFLPASKTSCLDDGMNCTVDNIRIDCTKEGGSRSLFCDQKMSQQCESAKCHDTLGEDFDVCSVRKFQKDERCGFIKPSRITAPNESLVYLRLYHNENKWGGEALVNVTLPAPAWKDLSLQYTFIGTGFGDACRRFTIQEHVNSTLMYECKVINLIGDAYRSTKLTVKSDSGEGASYLFRVPPGLKIHPEKTCPSDWHVFFYIHMDALKQYGPLPVTVQSSPFGQVTYRVVLARCHNPEDEKCCDFEELDHKLETKNTTDDLWITYLSKVPTGGSYTVRVQMVSDWCPKPRGCRVSVSPRFEVPSSLAWIALLLTICMILMFLASIVIVFFHRQKINREFFKGLKNKQPTVLLVYHPESQAALSFVKTIAEFLKNTCCVTYLMADLEVGTENPSNWTKTHMNEANRVLFIIPKDSESQSFTPIRDQWKVALNHCIGHEFITSQEHVKRLAKLVHPASDSVPCEIKDIRRFELSHSPAALANWLHDGSFLDQIFLWLPHIRSSTKKNISPTWTDVKLAAQKITLPLTTPNSNLSAIQTCPPEGKVEVQEVSSDGEFSDDDGDDKASVSLAFDPEIPAVNDKLCEPCQESSSSPENSEGENDENDVFE